MESKKIKTPLSESVHVRKYIELKSAARTGDIKSVKRLSEEVDPAAFAASALVTSIVYNNEECVRCLAPVSGLSYNGVQALVAAVEGSNKKYVGLFMQHGAKDEHALVAAAVALIKDNTPLFSEAVRLINPHTPIDSLCMVGLALGHTHAIEKMLAKRTICDPRKIIGWCIDNDMHNGLKVILKDQDVSSSQLTEYAKRAVTTGSTGSVSVLLNGVSSTSDGLRAALKIESYKRTLEGIRPNSEASHEDAKGGFSSAFDEVSEMFIGSLKETNKDFVKNIINEAFSEGFGKVRQPESKSHPVRHSRKPVYTR